MKSIVCEMCGSNDIVKKDGLYVCQFCGTKYSVEDAKKMMIDGTVNTQTGIQNFWCNDCGYSWTKFDNGMYGDKYGYGF